MNDPTTLRPVDPASGAALPEVPCTSGPELLAAVARARAASREWTRLGAEERGRRVLRFADRLLDREASEPLARTMTSEMGKPIRQARSEIDLSARRCRGLVERAIEACRDEVAREGGIEVVTQWRPLGVAAVIGPWNYPVSTPHHLVVSALLTGNTVVFKPSEQTPQTGALYCDMLAAELPPGVCELVQGDGNTGAALVRAAVDLIAFTGSIATGQAIMRAAADSMKRLVLELGGKDPMIVLPGADLEAAARYAASGALVNAGQVCVAVERILVHRDVHDEFLAKVVARVEAMRIGDPTQDDTEMGPMANAHQRELVQRRVAQAKDAGARVVVEGRARNPGWWLSPTVLDGVTPDMDIAREETFGPVVALEVVASADEAIERANGTRYGLGASVWGPPGPELESVAERIEAGMVGINRGLSAAAGAPWVGWKMSGFGYTRSVSGMRQLMIPRTLSRNIG